MTDYSIPEQKLAADVKAVLSDIDDLLAAVKSGATETVRAVQPRVEAGILRARARMTEVEGTVAARARQAAREANAYVHHHPWETTAIAAALGAAAGVLIGMLVERNR